MSHPGSHGEGPALALHPRLASAVPRSTLSTSVLLAWAEAAALALTMVALGRGLDQILAGESARGAILLTAAGVVVAAASAATQTLFSARARLRAEAELRDAVLDAVHQGGVRAAAHRSSALVQAATDACERTARYRAAFLGPILGTFTTPFVVLAVLGFSTSWSAAGVLAVMVISVPFIVRIAQSASGDAGATNRRDRAQLAQAFLAAVQGLGTLVTHRAAERTGEELEARGEKHRRSLMRVLAVNQMTVLAMDAAVTVALMLSAVLLALRGLSVESLTPGGALTVVLAALLATLPSASVGQFFYIGIGGRASQQAINAHLHAADEISAGESPADENSADESPAGQTPAGEVPALALTAVNAGWRSGHDVLHDLSLHLDPGERVALVGPSGVGKSTVSALVQGHLGPRTGTVRVHGRDPVRHGVGEGIAVVEQRTFLFQSTLAENLRLAAPGASDDDLWEALAVAGLADQVAAMPAGLQTVVGEHGLTLSGGQSQRVAIARAVLRDAPLLLLDEPTSQVDLASEAAFLERLDALAEGRTVLMIAHRPGAILAADRVVTLSPGTSGAVPSAAPAAVSEASR